MPPYDPTSRDDITDYLLQQQNKGGALGAGLTGLGAGYEASPMTGPTLHGLPATPAGGVPGAGIGAAGPSSLPLPPQRTGMQGAMPSMGSLGAGMGGGQMTGMPPPQMAMPLPMPPPPAPRPGMLSDMGGTGQMSDFESGGQTPSRLSIGPDGVPHWGGGGPGGQEMQMRLDNQRSGGRMGRRRGY